METKEEAKSQLLELFNRFNVVAGNNKVRIPLTLKFPNGEVKSIKVTKVDDNIYISREYIGEVPSLTFEEILEYCRIIRNKIGMRTSNSNESRSFKIYKRTHRQSSIRRSYRCNVL